MVSKKKRPPPALESSETNLKKSKLVDGAGTSSSGTNIVSGSKNSSVSKKTNDGKVKEELDHDDPLPVMENNSGNDFPHWPQADLQELMKRMEACIPVKDTLSFASRTEKLDWDMISFGDHSAQDCKETWSKIQKRLRKFRLLKEVLEDAKVWVSKPWTNFYRSQKQNRHPGMPKKPLSSYMLFYMDKKDKVAKEHPGLEMTALSKYIAEMYKTLPTKKKQKYSDMAAIQRKEYEEKLDQFYQEHPELLPKHEKGEGRSHAEVGPKRPKQPFKLYFEDKLKRHKNDPGFDRSSFLEKCKEQWRNMPDKKKVVWINWALEEETRYAEELKAYMSENPEFVPANVRTVLTKEEKTLRERVAGKPEKPPNSGYSLFSRLMLSSDHIKEITPKKRMIEISRLWKSLSEIQKRKYQEQVNHMLDQYKLEYATYLESLPEDKRQEELQNNMPKPRKPMLKSRTLSDNEKEEKDTRKKASKHPKSDSPPLHKGEPELPPSSEYHLFVKCLSSDQSHNYSEKEAPKLWQMLPDSEKAKYRKKLKEIKAKYIEDYEKFLNSLSQEELKVYSAKKGSSKKENVDNSDESAQDDSNSSSDDDDDDDNEDSGSDDSSSDSDSGSSDSSDSNDADSKNSDSSSSVSDDSD